MCSIIGLTGSGLNMRRMLSNQVGVFLKNSLDIKGGDEYGIVLMYKGFAKEYESLDAGEIKGDIYEISNGDDNSIATLLMFSRMIPEMETEENLLKQPYYNKNDKIWYMVHGTIPNAEKFKKGIQVDTEIMKYSNTIEDGISYIEKQSGKISLLGFKNDDEDINTKNIQVDSYTNGLGLYKYLLTNKFSEKTTSHHFEINMFSNLDIETDYTYLFNKETLVNTIKVNKPTTRIISLFSGGLDITCSTMKTIDNNIEKIIETKGSIDLWYFDWDSVASDMEKESVIDTTTHISNRYNINKSSLNCEIIDIKDMFGNILNICDIEKIRLSDNEAKGKGNDEAEAAINYVPLRNAFLINLAVAKAEQLYPNDNCIFVLGANLSEGMIYLDNSETFVNGMNKLIKVSGQSTYNFELQSPFVNMTKTKMLEWALENDINTNFSFSCYFPKDGKECGECGSCILKNKAKARANENISNKDLGIL